MSQADFAFQSKYNITDLLDIMKRLRAPDGCPWDREQDHHTVRNNFLEETYEVIDAIDRENRADLCEELGDVLLQIVFHSQMEAEVGGFDFDDVCDGICKKLIERHPHVFGTTVVSGSEQVLDNWDAIKQKSKNQTTYTQTLESVPKAFPALMRAAKIQKRAAKAGFDWSSVAGALEKVDEELKEFREALAKGEEVHISEEFGDLLFSMVNVSRFLKIDSEQALQSASEKFISRFSIVEQMAIEQGIDMKSVSLEELDKLWDKAKNSNK